jgi:hypothetical protein
VTILDDFFPFYQHYESRAPAESLRKLYRVVDRAWDLWFYGIFTRINDERQILYRVGGKTPDDSRCAIVRMPASVASAHIFLPTVSSTQRRMAMASVQARPKSNLFSPSTLLQPRATAHHFYKPASAVSIYGLPFFDITMGASKIYLQHLWILKVSLQSLKNIL